MTDTGLGNADRALSRRQFLVSSGVLFGAMALAGCSSSGTAGSTKTSGSVGATGGQLHYAEAGTFETFDPWSQEPVEQDIVNQIFSRLVYVDAHGKPVADLAQSWKLADDAMSMELTLRPGLTWHNGRKVTGSDFVTMFGYLTNPKMKKDPNVQQMIGLFEPVASVTAPNDRTIQMKFKSPIPYIFDVLTYWYLVDFDNQDDLDFLKHLPVGTGPFKLTKFDAATGATLEAFDNYHGGKPKVGSVLFSTYSTGSSLISDLRAGQADGVIVTNASDLKAIAGDSQFDTLSARWGVWDMMVNCAKKPFDDVRVRQALSYSMDRKRFAEVAFFGYEVPTCTAFYNPAATGYDPSLVNATPFDLGKAKSLLTSAGVDSLNITFPYPVSYPNLERLGELWQADLKQIGVKLTLKPISFALWAGKIIYDKSLDVLIYNNGRVALDGAVFWQTQGNWLSGDPTAMGYKDPRITTLTAQGVKEADPAKRKQIYQELNKIATESAHCIAIASVSNIWAFSSRVSGQASDILGNLELGGASFA